MAVLPVSRGENNKIRFQFESSYGVRATGNYIQGQAFNINGMRGQSPLLTERTIGAGVEPQAPFRGSFNVDPSLPVPIDHRIFPYYLKNLMGAAQTPATLGARGYIEFTAQPANNSTMTINGVTWTFVTSGATGNQTNIGANLQATIDAAVSDLNGSADTDIDDATYSRLGNRLVISHDTADSSGNSFTLATNVTGAEVSKATLYGGGLISHEFRSGTYQSLTDLKPLTFEVDDPAFTGGNRYLIADGVVMRDLEFTITREGIPRATLSGAGRYSNAESSSVAGTPTVPTYNAYFQKQSFVLIDDVRLDSMTNAVFRFSNGLLKRETVVADGLVEAVDPGARSASINFDCYHSNNALAVAADAESTVTARMGFLDKTSGSEISFYLNEVHLPRPDTPYEAEGYTVASYEAQAAEGAARSLTVTVINDVSSYT